MADKPKKPTKPKVDAISEIPADVLAQIEAMLKNAHDDDSGEEEASAQDVLDYFLDIPFEDGGVSDILGDLQEALTTLRIEANGGSRPAREESEALRQHLAGRLEDPDIELDKLMALAQIFGQADFNPGPIFGAALAHRVDAETPEGTGEADLETLFDSVIDDADGNPFTMFEAASGITRFMPSSYVHSLAVSLAQSNRPALREAALGFLLEPDAELVGEVCRGLVRPSQFVPSSQFLDRLVRMRGLMPGERHADIDAVIKALRPKATGPETPSKVRILSQMASVNDGSGAQALVSHVAEGRNHSLISVLIKLGSGIGECLVMGDMTKRDVESLLEGSSQEMDFSPVSSEFIVRRLGAAIADNHAYNNPVSYNLIGAMEKLCIPALRPERVSTEALIDDMLAEAGPADAALSAAGAAKIINDSGFSESWFEAGEAIDTLFDQAKSRKQRREALLSHYLPTRRQFWIEQCAWTAAALKDQAPKSDRLWYAVALLGKQLCGAGPVAETALMQFVADATIKAYMLQ